MTKNSRLAWSVRRAALGCLLASVAAAAAMDAPVVWGGLSPGPHAVGFTHRLASDPSRAYFPNRGDRETDLARPIQATIWYPARPATGEPMQFGDFVSLAAAELGPGRGEGKEAVSAEFRRGPLRPYYDGGPSAEDWERVLAIPVASRRGAAAASGRFPLILHAGIAGATAQGVLFEYLASHGYVVVSVPLLGTSPAWHGRGEWTVRSLEEMAADLGVAARLAGELPSVDAERVAVLGMSAGAHGVLYAMRSRSVDAVVALEATWPPAVAQSPHFDVAAFRAPILDVPSEQIRRTTETRDRLRYAEKIVARIAGSTHAASYQFRRLALAGSERSPAEARRAIADEHRQYETVARLARKFLDWKLKDDANAEDAILATGARDEAVAIERIDALPPVPTEGDLLALVRMGEVPEAARLVALARDREPEIVLFGEEPMTTTARFLARDRGFETAVEAFRLIAEAYPGSPRALENLGDALSRLERSEEAARWWRRALAALPAGDADARARLEQKLAGF